jgi:hypothetical protein
LRPDIVRQTNPGDLAVFRKLAAAVKPRLARIDTGGRGPAITCP